MADIGDILNDNSGIEYRIDQKIESGKCAIAYKGIVLTGKNTGLPILIKEFSPDRTILPKTLPECQAKVKSLRNHFLVEAKTLERLTTEQICPTNIIQYVSHIQKQDGQKLELYTITEFIEGIDLQKLAKESRKDNLNGLPIRDILDLTSQVAYALSGIHSKNIIHGDIKQDNIMVRSEGRNIVAILADFGICREFTNNGQQVTQGLGPPGISPIEQFAGNPILKSDVHQLGVTLHETLTGLSATRLYNHNTQTLDIAFTPDYGRFQKSLPQLYGQQSNQIYGQLGNALYNLIVDSTQYPAENRPTSAQFAARIDALRTVYESALEIEASAHKYNNTPKLVDNIVKPHKSGWIKKAAITTIAAIMLYVGGCLVGNTTHTQHKAPSKPAIVQPHYKPADLILGAGQYPKERLESEFRAYKKRQPTDKEKVEIQQKAVSLYKELKENYPEVKEYCIPPDTYVIPNGSRYDLNHNGIIGK